jgi:cell division protein FtsI/penicillin-binding protein 2
VNISGSIRRLTNIFLILFVVLSAGLVYWQVVAAQQVTSNPYLTYTRQCTSEAAPIRGNIYDSQGVLLAYSVKSNIPGLCGYKRVYTPAAQGLEGLIGYYISPQFTSTGVESQFNDYLTGKTGLTGLDNTVNNILHVPPHGDDIYLTIDSRIEHILVQNFTIEAPIDNAQTYKTDRGSVIVSNPKTGEILGILSEPGYDANCVVNCSLALLRQDMLAKGYDQTIGCTAPCSMNQFQAALDGPQAQNILQGQGVTLGSGRALGSNCEDNNACNLIYLALLNSDPKQPTIFRPTQDCYPPGSTYKTVTLMAALDSGTMNLDSPFYQNDPTHPYPQYQQAEGPITVRGVNNDTEQFTPQESNILGYTHRFPVNLAYGYSHSDNVIFAETGVNAGADTWMKYNHALYIDQKIPFDLPVKVSTVTPQPQANLCSYNAQNDTALNVPTLAENSFGQGRDFVTPLQMMLVNNVAANDGQLMRPTIIQKIVDPKNQTTLQSFTPQMLRQVISAQSAQGVRDAMYGVNECGSGLLSLARLSFQYTPWSVVGKTGTAQVSKANPNDNIGGDSWFITQAPYLYHSNEIPAITITAMKENGGEGAYANGPMLNADYNQIFTNVIKIPTPPPPPGGINFCYNTGLLQN